MSPLVHWTGHLDMALTCLYLRSVHLHTGEVDLSLRVENICFVCFVSVTTLCHNHNSTLFLFLWLLSTAGLYLPFVQRMHNHPDGRFLLAD